MFQKKKIVFLFVLLAITSMVFSACGTTAQPTTTTSGEPQTVIVTVEVEKLITPTTEVVSFDQAPDPTTLTYVTADDAASLDPHLAYEGSSYEIIDSVLEGLIAFKRDSASDLIPILAKEVPTTENGGISADGLTYTFTVRDGIKYSNGNDLTASDVAFSFERVLLQSDPNSGAWMMLESIMGFNSDDVTENIAEGEFAGDQAALIAGATPEELKAVCEDVKSHFTADDATGTFSVTLAAPFAPFMSIIARPWAYVLDKEWTAEVGDWDGSCDTWQNFYAPGQEGTKLGKVIMGTGPYVLDHWTPDQEWMLTANESYWRQEGDAMWEGGPSGIARIKNILHKTIPEWGTRFAMLQTGDAAWVEVPLTNRTQADAWVGEICDNVTGECTPTDNPTGPLRVFLNLANTSRADIFMNQNVKTGETGENPYIGSGQMDGNGIKPDFFSDIHIRKAFSYCFDYDTYIAEGQNGDGVRNNGVIITNMLGYNPDQAMYPFDLDKCKEEMDLAWDGEVAANGFRVQAITATGYPDYQTALAILQANLRTVDPKYKIEVVTLPWASYLAAFRAGLLPIAISAWSEDYHDPHNWVQPFLVGTYATRQNFSDEFKAIFQPLISQAVAETDAAKRAELYYQIEALRYDNVPEVTLSQSGERHYEQRWVRDYYYNPVMPGRYFYAFDLAGSN